MYRFSQTTLDFYLGSKREKLLSKSLASHKIEHLGERMTKAMEERRRFLRHLSSSKRYESLLKRGYVDLPLMGPPLGLNGHDHSAPMTESLQTKAFKVWLEGYWRTYGFSLKWYLRDDCPDSMEMDWPRPQVHIVQGPTTPIWVLRISWS